MKPIKNVPQVKTTNQWEDDMRRYIEEMMRTEYYRQLMEQVRRDVVLRYVYGSWER